jgi:hypothetical protein
MQPSSADSSVYSAHSAVACDGLQKKNREKKGKKGKSLGWVLVVAWYHRYPVTSVLDQVPGGLVTEPVLPQIKTPFPAGFLFPSWPKRATISYSKKGTKKKKKDVAALCAYVEDSALGYFMYYSHPLERQETGGWQ